MTSSPKHPRTLSEWRAWIDALPVDTLVEAAHDANAIAFVEVLESEGYAPAQIHAVVHAFARRFVALDVRPPAGGLYDFVTLARRPAPDADDAPGIPPSTV
ncbi:MAG: hypothetical protein FJ137_06850 [Deltaproteobacteria bacterium]|nr:hypothetical protein [Deltaproteobacteria bacterium]